MLCHVSVVAGIISAIKWWDGDMQRLTTHPILFFPH